MATGAIDQAGMAAALAPVEEAMQRASARCAPPETNDADLRAFYGMMRYHLGWADATFAPALADGANDSGRSCWCAARSLRRRRQQRRAGRCRRRVAP